MVSNQILAWWLEMPPEPEYPDLSPGCVALSKLLTLSELVSSMK